MTVTSLLEKKEIFDNYLKKASLQLSGFSFVNIFIWQDFFSFDFRIIDEHLCIFARDQLGVFLYLPPLGKGSFSPAIEQCFEIMETDNRGSTLTRIENLSEEQLNNFDQDRFEFFKRADEYCYAKKDIAELKGNQYKSKRSSYNKFVKNNLFEYCRYDATMQEECLALYARWSSNRAKTSTDEIYNQMLIENQQVHRTALEHYQALALVGRVVKVEGQIKAYSFGYPLNADTFCILFEITDLEIPGLAVFIFSEICKDPTLNNYQYLNTMDDFGLPNIAQVKRSFHPQYLLPVFSVRKKEENE